MAKVHHYLPQINNKFLCTKGGLHAESPLNIVCLDPLCRTDPLGCSICFANTHKYHKVVSVDKFVDEYSRNVRQGTGAKNLKKIQKHHQQVKQLIWRLKQDVNKELQDFEQSINEYADELRAKTVQRDYISKIMKVELEPSRLKNTKSNEEFVDFLKFALNNSLFDKDSNMIQVANVLKQDEERIYALLDRMVNMTEQCQEHIKQVMKSLNFSDETIKHEKMQFKKQIDQLQLQKECFNPEKYYEQEAFNKTLTQKIDQQKTFWRKSLNSTAQKETQERLDQPLTFTFSSLKKHEMIELKEKSKVGVSNITAIKPQYALITPHLNTHPTQVQQWTIKINNCRNFASENTMAVGLAPESHLKNANFEGKYPESAVLVTSQGYIIQNKSSSKSSLIFGSGDTLHCKYDPFYKLFEVSKENGRAVTLKVEKPENQDLFACVRLTYASDQVQIL